MGGKVVAFRPLLGLLFLIRTDDGNELCESGFFWSPYRGFYFLNGLKITGSYMTLFSVPSSGFWLIPTAICNLVFMWSKMLCVNLF